MIARPILFASSIALLAGFASAGPLDLLFGGEPKAAPPSAAPASVKRLGDAELGCEALYAEVTRLEALEARSQADGQGNSSGPSGKALMSGLAQGLLSAVPLFGEGGRGGAVAGILASKTMSAQAQSSAQQSQQAQLDAATASQRRDHLVELFERKRCKVAELKK